MSSTTFTLSYLRDIEKYRTEKPFNLSFSKYHDGIVTNVEQEDRLVEVHDVRGKESDFTCTSHSFSYRTFPTKYPIDGTEAQTFQHLEEAQQFLKQEFDAVEVICYDIRVCPPKVLTYHISDHIPDCDFDYSGDLQIRRLRARPKGQPRAILPLLKM